MTSSPALKFSFAKRRLLFLSAQKATIYHWQNGRLGTSYLFDVDEEGRDNFERYLRETPNTVMYILIDIFEEEYRRDTIPHVFGPDRTAILERKKARLFRDTHYHFTRVLGREESGRRDDAIFLSAITNPGIVDRWVDILDKYKVPLAGIHSLPLFTESLISEIPQTSDYMLVVTMQSISGLRQTFFQKRKFRISRLVQMPRYGTSPYGPYINDEVEKIHRYLSSLRLTSLDEPLDIYFLLAGSLLDDLKEQYQDTPAIRYHFLDINDLARDSGLTDNINTPFSDQYIAYQFLKKRPLNCYATRTNIRYSAMRRMRISMLAVSIMLIMLGMIWSGFNFMGGLTLKQRSLAADSRAEFYQTRYEIARGRLQQTPVEPVDLKIAVDLAGTLKKYSTSPVLMFKTISRALNRFPAISLSRMEWKVTGNPDMNVGSGPNNSRNQVMAGLPAMNAQETGYLNYQVAVVNGYIKPFDGDYRKAIDTINRFAEFLKKGDSVYDVMVISLPLDISSSASLSGNTQQVQNEAKFSLRVTLGIKDES